MGFFQFTAKKESRPPNAFSAIVVAGEAAEIECADKINARRMKKSSGRKYQ